MIQKDYLFLWVFNNHINEFKSSHENLEYTKEHESAYLSTIGKI